MEKSFNYSNLLRAVDHVVDQFLNSLNQDVDPATMKILYRKYHDLGATLVEAAYLLSLDTVRTRPWLPVTLVESICRTINNVSAPKSYS